MNVPAVFHLKGNVDWNLSFTIRHAAHPADTHPAAAAMSSATQNQGEAQVHVCEILIGKVEVLTQCGIFVVFFRQEFGGFRQSRCDGATFPSSPSSQSLFFFFFFKRAHERLLLYNHAEEGSPSQLC